MMTPKSPFEINWPLVTARPTKYGPILTKAFHTSCCCPTVAAVSIVLFNRIHAFINISKIWIQYPVQMDTAYKNLWLQYFYVKPRKLTSK